jgi:hypothetical protein
MKLIYFTLLQFKNREIEKQMNISEIINRFVENISTQRLYDLKFKDTQTAKDTLAKFDNDLEQEDHDERINNYPIYQLPFFMTFLKFRVDLLKDIEKNLTQQLKELKN